MGFKLSTHNGKVTVVSPSGEWRTFQIRTQKPGQWCEGKRIVALLSGPDNTSDYEPFGFVNAQGQIVVWKKKRGGVFDTYANMLTAPSKWIAKGVEYMVEGHCRRCNRVLTVPSSIQSGIGPVCAGK
jgi:hypothetical protein